MKVTATTVCICLTLFLWCGGCSREEPPPVQKIKEVKPIKMPIPEHAQTSVPDEEEKVKTGVKEAQEAETAALPTALRLVSDRNFQGIEDQPELS